MLLEGMIAEHSNLEGRGERCVAVMVMVEVVNRNITFRQQRVWAFPLER